jgi:hypothetical protein
LANVFTANSGLTTVTGHTTTGLAPDSEGNIQAYLDANRVYYWRSTDLTLTGIIPAFVLPYVTLTAYGAGQGEPALDGAAWTAAHDALPANGGIIFVPAGTYYMPSTVTFTKAVLIVGEGRNSVISSAAVLTYLAKWIPTAGVRIFGGGARDIALLGTGTITGGLFIDSAHGMIFENIYGTGILDYLLVFSSNVTANSEGHFINHVESMNNGNTRPKGVVKMLAGTTGTVTDSLIGVIRSEGLSEDLLQLVDCRSITLLKAYGSVSTASGWTFRSMVNITNDATGSPPAGTPATETGWHDIHEVYLEDQSVLAPPNSAVGVIINGASTTGRLTRYNWVGNVVSSKNRVLIHLKNSGTALSCQLNSVHVKNILGFSGFITIDANVAQTNVFLPFSTHTIASNLVDSGYLTRVNGSAFGTYTPGVAPTAADSDVGLTLLHLGDNSLWYEDRIGTLRRIHDGDLFQQGTATIPAAGTSIVVDHNVPATLDPVVTAKDFMITPTSSWGTATKFWISAVSTTQLTISVDIAPGGVGMSVAWWFRRK